MSYLLQKLDIYIIKKFLGTFFFALLLILSIAVVFDLVEKIDDFMENNAPWKAVVFDYYLNFIPYFAVLISPLFTFISVIYFTSRMAFNTEIIAILSSGVSFNRILRPYILSAIVIAIFSFTLNNYILPDSTKKKLAFEDVYYHSNPASFQERNFHRQIEPGLIVYLESFHTIHNSGIRFSLERFVDGELVSKLNARSIRWDSTINKWNVYNYYIRNFYPDSQVIVSGKQLDTTLNMYPDEFKVRKENIEGMDLNELSIYIEEQKEKGATAVERLQVEKHKRYAMPFSTFILTLIGVSVSSRKMRGGTGIHIGIGLALSFSYIFFTQFSTQFAISGTLTPFLAVWLPNFMFTIVALFMYRMLPK